jgi:hypothetical protein
MATKTERAELLAREHTYRLWRYYRDLFETRSQGDLRFFGAYDGLPEEFVTSPEGIEILVGPFLLTIAVEDNPSTDELIPLREEDGSTTRSRTSQGSRG